MQGWKRAAAGAALFMASLWPAAAEANGEHVHFGELHFDPLVGAGVGIFVGLITLMFVGQWIRFNAARRGAAGSAESQGLAEEGEEALYDYGEEDDGKQREP